MPVTATPTDPAADHPPRGATATDVKVSPPAAAAAAGQRDREQPAAVLTTDAEAQTDDPLINPNNS